MNENWLVEIFLILCAFELHKISVIYKSSFKNRENT